jgi:hypothetical protein
VGIQGVECPATEKDKGVLDKLEEIFQGVLGKQEFVKRVYWQMYEFL